MKRSILMGKTFLTLVTALCVLVLGAIPSGAAVVGVSSELGITANGLIDWGVLGPNGTTVTRPFTIAVPGAFPLNVMVSGDADFERRDEGTGWSGHFGTGEEILWTGNSGTVISLQFSSLVTGMGAQIQSDAYGDFTASISAYNASDVLLGSFSITGSNLNNLNFGDDTNPFIGILSDSANISRVVFGVTVASTAGVFAINGPRVQTGAPAPVPEPSALLLLGSGLVGLLGYRRRKRMM